MLYKTHRNQLFRFLTKAGLNPQLFTEAHSTYHYRIAMQDADYLFEVAPGGSTSPYIVSTVPGIGKTVRRTKKSVKTWDEIQTCFLKWASLMYEEINAPDLWAEATKNAQLFEHVTEAPDEKFTRSELAQVQSQLRLLEQSFAAAALPEAAKKKLIGLTEEAAVKAESLTKKDWQNWIIGGFISAITGLMLNPTQAAEVLKLVKAAFGGLFLH